MADPTQPQSAGQSPRLLALRNLAKNLPAANSRIAEGQKAARDMQLQQAVAAAPASTRSTQAAQQIGQQQAATAGKQMVESAAAATAPKGTLARMGGQAVEEQQQQAQSRIAGLQAGSREQQMDNVQKFATLSEKAKQELYDKQMQFARDEQGRTLFNEQQLADWARTKAQSSEEFKNYAQQAEKLSKRRLQAMEYANKLVQEDLAQQYKIAEEQKDRKTAQDIRVMQQQAADRAEREKARHANGVGAWTTGGAIVGTAVGAYFGGPAGAAAGGQLGGSIGGAVGSSTSSKPGEG